MSWLNLGEKPTTSFIKCFKLIRRFFGANASSTAVLSNPFALTRSLLVHALNEKMGSEGSGMFFCACDQKREVWLEQLPWQWCLNSLHLFGPQTLLWIVINLWQLALQWHHSSCISLVWATMSSLSQSMTPCFLEGIWGKDRVVCSYFD